MDEALIQYSTVQYNGICVRKHMHRKHTHTQTANKHTNTGAAIRGDQSGHALLLFHPRQRKGAAHRGRDDRKLLHGERVRGRDDRRCTAVQQRSLLCLIIIKSTCVCCIPLLTLTLASLPPPCSPTALSHGACVEDYRMCVLLQPLVRPAFAQVSHLSVLVDRA